LPVPFIKYLYENGKQEFLDVYKKANYESPILIWNSELRGILENEIREHSQGFIEKLKEFASQPPQDMKGPIPQHKEGFQNIIRYKQIDSEVRCGRYYLRVWVNQKKNNPDFFGIPKEEEVQFYSNLQAELRYSIYEEHFKEKEKIIILFKSCLLALNK